MDGQPVEVGQSIVVLQAGRGFEAAHVGEGRLLGPWQEGSTLTRLVLCRYKVRVWTTVIWEKLQSCASCRSSNAKLPQTLLLLGPGTVTAVNEVNG